MDTAELLLDILAMAGEKWGANVLLVMTDRPQFAEAAVEGSRLPVILATGDRELMDRYKEGDDVRAIIRLKNPLSGSVHILQEAKEVLVQAFLQGTVKADDRVACVAANVDAVDVLAFFDVERDVELVHLRHELEDRIDPIVVERVVRLATEIAREGREGQAIGTLFVVGDTASVLDRSRQAVINPFKGHTDDDRDITRDEVAETVKEFSVIDGAFVIDEHGRVQAAGRYIDVDKDVPVPSGLGGRHLAAASITRTTSAVAVAVSSSGAVRVFKDGRIIMVLGRA